MAINLNAEPCHAVFLAPNTSAPASAEAKPDAGANLVIASGAVVFNAPSFSGKLTSNVYKNDSTNPYGLDRLTFTYLIENDVSSLHDLHRFTVSSFTGFQTDVSYSNNQFLAGMEPTFADSSPGGDVIGFAFPISVPGLYTGFPITPGSTSRLLIIQTDAFDWKDTEASVINGSTKMVASFAPEPLVPEPSTLVLAAMGLAFTVIAAVRKSRRASSSALR